MLSNTLIRSYRFMFENAGYVVGERAKCALALARAEQWMSERDDDEYRIRWDWDDDVDLSWMDEKERAKPHECTYCVIEQRCECCGRWRCIVALNGIVDADDKYKRVVEAELATEAMGMTHEHRCCEKFYAAREALTQAASALEHAAEVAEARGNGERYIGTRTAVRNALAS
jgi:hypothetical protein